MRKFNRELHLLESNETTKHINTKIILFNKLKNHKVILKDIYGNTYDVYRQKYPNEFLYVESFLAKEAGSNTFNNEILLSGNNSICKKYVCNPYCNFKPIYGAVEDIPCRQCMTDNINKDDYCKGLNIDIGYSPDIGWGYNDEYKTWIEIKNKHGCDPLKIQYCYQNKITLLEVDAGSVSKDSQIIYVNNLLDIRTWEDSINRAIKSVFNDISKLNYSTLYTLVTDYNNYILYIHIRDIAPRL